MTVDVNTLRDNVIIPWLIEQAEQHFGGSQGAAKKAWVVTQITMLLELVDDKIPVVGRYMDTAFADKLQTLVVAEVVQKVFDASPLAKK